MENVIALVVTVAVMVTVAVLIWNNDLDYEGTRKSVDEDPTECWPHDN